MCVVVVGRDLRVHVFVSDERKAFVEHGTSAILPAAVGGKQCQPSHIAGHGKSSAERFGKVF